MTQTVVRFGFRPWVRRAGLSIVAVSAATTMALVLSILASPRARFGWAGEPAIWVYIAVLWLGGLRVWLATYRPIAEIGDRILIRPLHVLGHRAVAWNQVLGTEQNQGGDRLLLYYDTGRGMRFIALNLNLVRGRREFLALIEKNLAERGFVERLVHQKRYFSPAR